MKYFIGIDSGTSGIKAVVFDLDGKELAKQAFPLEAYTPTEYMFEEDMNEIWDKAKKCVATVAAQFPKEDIVGIGITAQGDGMWLIDENGDPVCYGCCFCDGRAAEFVDKWVADGTAKKLFDISGNRIFTGNQNGIVAWFDKYQPETLDKTAWILHLKDYLYYKLTGNIATDATDQSLIFLDMNKRDYNEDAFELCGLSKYRDKYAPVLSPKESAHVISKTLADELGLNDQIVVTIGPMDVVACALGAGVVEAGDCCTIMGTAAIHEMVVDAPMKDDTFAGLTVTHVTDDGWLRLMPSLAGTPNIEWMLDTIGAQVKIDAEKANMSVYDYMDSIIEKTPIGANGVMYHPYLLAGGERAPFTDPRARASYTGIAVRHTINDIVRATYEGVVFAMMDCYNHMPDGMKKITLCGGGANSPTWCQMFADAMGVPITIVGGSEAGALGVCINNAVVQGYYKSYKDAVDHIIEVEKVYEPNMENHEKFAKLYPLYKLTWQQLADTWKLRSEILEG